MMQINQLQLKHSKTKSKFLLLKLIPFCSFLNIKKILLNQINVGIVTKENEALKISIN